jgi:polysaccharide export outer membrane protein
MNMRLKCDIRCFLLVAGVLSSSGGTALAQYTGPAIASPARVASAPASAMKVEYENVRIMPGDVISIATYGAPELTTTAQTSTGTIVGPGSPVVAGLKVGAQGEVVLPYLGAVKLAGLTLSEASIYLNKALKEGGFLVDPQVSVQLVDSPTRIVTVIGEVQRPSAIPAFEQLRLLDAISACGGFTTLASHAITVRRPGAPDPIIVQLGTDPSASNESNIPLMAGDTVIVPKVGNVFVVGQVKTQSAIPLSGNTPITVMRALAMAGGVNYGAALSKARIIRTTADNQHVEIMLDLKKLMYGKQQDVALISDDILFIPTNAIKAAVAAGGASVAASLITQGAYTASILK